MKLEVSTKHLNAEGILRVESVLGRPAARREAAWIVAASAGRSRVAAFPISILNRAAPPVIAIEYKGGHNGGMDNRKPAARIAAALRQKCPPADQSAILAAVQLVKAAITALSTEDSPAEASIFSL